MVGCAYAPVVGRNIGDEAMAYTVSALDQSNRVMAAHHCTGQYDEPLPLTRNPNHDQRRNRSVFRFRLCEGPPYNLG